MDIALNRMPVINKAIRKNGFTIISKSIGFNSFIVGKIIIYI